MDFERILIRPLEIVWEHKFLILLGILVALGSAGSTPGGGGGGATPTEPGEPQYDQDWLEDFSLEEGLALTIGIVVVLLIIVLALVVWVISLVARGGLIAGVNAVESGHPITFGQAFAAGWDRKWTLLGIGILPAIPGLLLGIGGAVLLLTQLGLTSLISEDLLPMAGASAGIMIGALVCLILPFVFLLSILQFFANRACMLENLGVMDSYRRGWNVITENLKEFAVLAVIWLILNILLTTATIVPGIIITCCCLLWPVGLILRGAFEAYASAVWTLAWRDWTGIAGAKVNREEALV